MSDITYLEKQVEQLSLIQLRQLRNKIDILISYSKPERKTLPISPITSRLLGVAKYDGDYKELLEDSISERWL
ncbi:MAG: hypothetical protein ILP07_00605 [Treponema sp.]|nr:hypothetical protein [Treponema sp.]